jgi:hypothetical protein
MRKWTFLGALAITIMVSTTARAALIFAANLTGASEVPANASPATGTATVTLEDDNKTLDVNVTFAGLTAPATASHIHCCAAPGANAPVVLSFVTAGFPVGVTAGTYTHSFDLTSTLSGIGVAAFIGGLEGGLAYVNIHDSNFPGGEIRGWLTPVPEPVGAGLLGLAAGALFAARRRRPVGL